MPVHIPETFPAGGINVGLGAGAGVDVAAVFGSVGDESLQAVRMRPAAAAAAKHLKNLLFLEALMISSVRHEQPSC